MPPTPAFAPKEPPEAQLVQLAQDGSPEARAALVRRCYRMVRGMVFRLLGSESDVEDVVQDVFVEAFGSLRKLRSSDSFMPWVGQITVNVVRVHLRRRRMLRRLGLWKTEPLERGSWLSPDTPADVAADLTRLDRVLDRMPERHRIAVLMRHLEGRQIDDIALMMRASRSSVKRWLAAGEARVHAAFREGLASLRPAPGGARAR